MNGIGRTLGSGKRSKAQNTFPIFSSNDLVTCMFKKPRELLIQIAYSDEIPGHPYSLKPLLLSRERTVLLWTFENLSRFFLDSLAIQQGRINKTLPSQGKEEIIDKVKLLQSRFEKKDYIRK